MLEYLDIPIIFQKVGGPFTIIHSLIGLDSEKKVDRYAVYHKETFIKGFEAGSASESPYQDAMEYVASALRNRLPELLDEEAFRKEISGFERDSYFDKFLNDDIQVESRVVESGRQFQIYHLAMRKALYISDYYQGTEEARIKTGMRDTLEQLRELHITQDIPIVKDMKELMRESAALSVEPMQEALQDKLDSYRSQAAEITNKQLMTKDMVYSTFIRNVMNAPTIPELQKEPKAKELYHSYAKEVLTSNGVWNNNTDKQIASLMLANGVRTNRINAALLYSPALLAKNELERGSTVRETIQNVRMQQPKIKKSRSRSFALQF